MGKISRKKIATNSWTQTNRGQNRRSIRIRTKKFFSHVRNYYARLMQFNMRLKQGSNFEVPSNQNRTNRFIVRIDVNIGFRCIINFKISLLHIADGWWIQRENKKLTGIAEFINTWIELIKLPDCPIIMSYRYFQYQLNAILINRISN